MSAATKNDESVTLSVEDMKRLKTRNRPRFSEEQVKKALKFQLANNCSLAAAAETVGMTAQTLAKRRDELAQKMGVTDDQQESQAAKPAKKKR